MVLRKIIGDVNDIKESKTNQYSLAFVELFKDSLSVLWDAYPEKEIFMDSFLHHFYETIMRDDNNKRF